MKAIASSLIGLLAITFLSSAGLRAQNGVSSASASRARTESETPASVPPPVSNSRSPYFTPARAVFDGPGYSTVPPTPDRIAVEEIVNYRRHSLPRPKSGQGIALDVRWGNGTVSPGQPAVLQVGLATAEFDDTSDLRPLNLALVIDHSGSMAAADKMIRVKQSLQTLIGRLRPSDIVSIVVFDGSAQVVLPATALGNGQRHRMAIERIQPAGSTNINSGLMLGYEEAMRNFGRGYTNRVILLTDGIANEGERDPRRIAENSEAYNRRGIDLSTIGVGSDLDNDLLRTLARSGHGLYHFVADSRDIEKVFIDEVQSLISPVARNVHVEIASPLPLRLQHIYGYEPHFLGDHVAFDLDNLNNGATEVIMLRYDPETAGQVTVRLSYFDIRRQRTVEETQTASLRTGNGRNFLQDPEVRKNFTIANIAQALSDMQTFWKNSNYRAAENMLRAAVTETHERYPRMEDEDIRSQLNVAENYLSTLHQFNSGRGGL
jgi:Ca-activated chloride channel family protein